MPAILYPSPLAQGLPAAILGHLPAILAAAQGEYDAWEQDDGGFDEKVGVGGICQEIADAIGGVLSRAGFDAITVDNQGVGEQHVWLLAALPDGIYSIDIPARVYERGGGYVWKKTPGVVFQPEHLVVSLTNDDPDSLDQYRD